MDTSKPMSGFRKHILLPIFIFVARMLFFSGGFMWIKHKGRRSSCKEAPILVLAPHSSFYDALVFVSLGMPSVVGKTETALSPIGSLLKMTQPILVNRDNPLSRQNTLSEIRNRAQSGGKWQQVLIFPEGTCTNRSSLINFKQGAFTVGCPVQPAILRWGFAVDSVTWTWNGPGVLALLLFTILQTFITLEIEFLPVYVPNEVEKEDPQIYSENVRSVMARAANLPVTDLGFDDCRRILKAVQFNLPIAGHINEYGKLSQYLFNRDDSAHLDRPSVSDRLLAMATSVQRWHADGCEALSGEQIANIFLVATDEPHVPSRVALLSRVVHSLPKTSNGQHDIRALVVHLCFLVFSESPSAAMRLAFQAFTSAVDPPDQDTNATIDTRYAKHTERSISKMDAARVLTFVYKLSMADAISLLSKVPSIGGAIRPDFLCQAMNSHYPLLVSSYADYAREQRSTRGRCERDHSDTSSASTSSLYAINANGEANGHWKNTPDASDTDQAMQLRQRSTANTAPSL